MMQQYGWGKRQRSLFPRYRAIVAASIYMRDEYNRAGAPPENVHAIPLFAPPHASGNASLDAPRAVDVLFLGRLTTLKGPDVVVEAAAHAAKRLGRGVSIVIAGVGPERERLETLAAAAGVTARFPGWLAPRERDDLLRQASIIAVPSRWAEPFGLVGLEAGVFGTPAVAFDAGGIGDWLVHDENGRLVGPTRGATGFGDAIAEILASPELWRRLSAGARDAAARFSLENHVRALLPVLEHAAG
jgi:glycosyltransferase involved in cell wall biosynthesis